MLYGFKRLQYRSFVRKSFPKANESRQEKKDKMLVKCIFSIFFIGNWILY